MRMALLVAILGLVGCINRTQSETGAVHGQINGQPVSVQWTRDTDGRTSITVPPLVTAASGFLPSPWGEIAGGVLALVAGGGAVAARSQAKRADEHKADAAEGWSRALSRKGET